MGQLLVAFTTTRPDVSSGPIDGIIRAAPFDLHQRPLCTVEDLSRVLVTHQPTERDRLDVDARYGPSSRPGRIV